MKIKKNVLVTDKLIILLLALAVLMPFLEIAQGFPAVRLEMVGVIVIWLMLLYGHFIKGEKISLAPGNVNRWFLLFGLAITLSIFHAFFFLEQQLFGRDFYEIIKLLFYFLIFNLVASATISVKEMKGIYFYALVILLISAFFGFAQSLNLANVNEWLSPYYTSETQMVNLLERGRITGTVPNPNEFGALMVLACALAFSGIFTFKNRLECLFCGLALICFVLALFLTLSRTSVIALIVALLLLMLINFRRFRAFLALKTLVITGIVFTAVIILFIFLLPESFFIRIGDFFDLSQAQSWHERLMRWEDNYAIWKDSKLFGWGPAKAGMTTLVDNEWLMLLRRYGIIGIVMFLGLIGSFFRGIWQCKKGAKDEGTLVLAGAIMATLAAYLVYMIAVVIYHSLQVMPIFLIMTGLVFSRLKDEETGPVEK